MREGAKLKQAKQLRSAMTDAEQALWYYLRAKRFFDLKFVRQAPVGPYIPDFICKHPPIIVEVDGGQHAIHDAQDRRRDDFLRKRGYTVLRFWNNDVLSNIEGVLLTIKQAVEAAPLPRPSPVNGRGEPIEQSINRKEEKASYA